jgi:hypothetical protein
MRGQFIDLTNERFEKLFVIEWDAKRKKWKCLCDCGKITYVSSSHLTLNHTRSCGCYHKERASICNTKHGQRRKIGAGTTKAYSIWGAIKARCHNPKNSHYHMYGGRGIAVCERWRNSFENFFEDMGECPSDTHSIDRYPDVNGNYEPGNCRWATPKEQGANTRKNVYFEYNGEKLHLLEWARRLDVSKGFITNRINDGKSFEKVVEEAKLFIANNRQVPHGDKIIPCNGEEMSQSAWARKLNISNGFIFQHLSKGDSFEDIIKGAKEINERREQKRFNVIRQHWTEDLRESA